MVYGFGGGLSTGGGVQFCCRRCFKPCAAFELLISLPRCIVSNARQREYNPAGLYRHIPTIPTYWSMLQQILLISPYSTIAIIVTSLYRCHDMVILATFCRLSANPA